MANVFAECDISKLNIRFDSLIFDPPIPLPKDVALDPLEPSMIEWDNTSYIADWVDADMYSIPADLIEDVRLHGFSWRLPTGLSFRHLDVNSRILLIHAKAWINNWDSYPPRHHPCPKNVHGPGEFCSGLWWEDMPPVSNEAQTGTRTIQYRNRQVIYSGQARPDAVSPDYAPRFFIAFPIHRIVVAGEGAQAFAATELAGCQLPVVVIE